MSAGGWNNSKVERMIKERNKPTELDAVLSMIVAVRESLVSAATNSTLIENESDRLKVQAELKLTADRIIASLPALSDAACSE